MKPGIIPSFVIEGTGYGQITVATNPESTGIHDTVVITVDGGDRVEISVTECDALAECLLAIKEAVEKLK